MLRLFVGHDPREEAGSHVFVSSVLEHAREPLAITHLHRPALEATFGRRFAEGSNAFTTSRFLVPALCDFSGPPAVFVDGADMLCLSDIAGIVAEADPLAPVSVVKHAYTTRHPRKYIGTAMEADNRDYERKQWASVMVIQPWHRAWRRLTPDAVADGNVLNLLQLRFLQDEQIGELPAVWNWLADEHGANDQARLLHWTAGVPGFPEHNKAAHAAQWRRQLARVNYLTD